MIDTHVHLAAADLRAYPHTDTPAFHTESYIRTAEEALEEMAEGGIAQALIVQPFALYGTDNSYHADSAAKYSNHFVGICGVAASSEGAEQLRHWVRERGMAGGRIVTLSQGIDFDNQGLIAVFTAAQELGVPMCLLTSRKYMADFPRFASRFSGVTIGLDHLGNAGTLIEPEAMIERLTPLIALDNVVLKISTSLLNAGEPGIRVMDFILNSFGPHRIAWGSNYPVTTLGGYAKTVAASRSALSFLSDSEREQIFAGTARRIWPGLCGATSE